MNVLKLVGGLLLGVALLVPAPVSAQLGTGDLRGKVVDPQGAVLPGVTVVAKNEASGQFRETVSGADGSFFMSALTPGIYELTRAAVGLQEIPARRRARRSRQDRRRLTCSSQVGGIEEEVTVTAESPLVDTTSKQIGGIVTVAGAERHPVDQPQLHGLSRHAAGRHGVHLDRLVRRRLDPRQRPGHAERRTTRSTAPATTTRSTAATAARRRARRSKRCRSSSC